MDDWQRINLMNASRKWIFQRISALIVAPLIVWFLLSLISLSTSDYNSVINFFSKPLFLFFRLEYSLQKFHLVQFLHEKNLL